MHRALKGILAVATFLVLLPAVSSAQVGQVAGTVRDTSGAVMPGVTVEVTSPALIEKVRSTTTDGSGQYRITNLPVGTYSVAFTLPGFSKQQQNDIVLTTGFTAPVNATMSVGALTDQVTVSGLRDYTGNVMTPFASSFTTRAVATNDSTAPAVAAISPVNGATGVGVTTPITVTLSEPIIAGLVSPTSLPIYAVVNGQFVQLAGTYVVDGTGTTITFTPLMPYPGSTLIWTYINATSTITDPGCIVFRSSRRISLGATAPGMRTAPTTKSAVEICSRML